MMIDRTFVKKGAIAFLLFLFPFSFCHCFSIYNGYNLQSFCCPMKDNLSKLSKICIPIKDIKRCRNWKHFFNQPFFMLLMQFLQVIQCQSLLLLRKSILLNYGILWKVSTSLPLLSILFKRISGSLLMQTIKSTSRPVHVGSFIILKYLSRTENSPWVKAPESLSTFQICDEKYPNSSSFTSTKQYLSLKRLLSIITTGDFELIAFKICSVLHVNVSD